MCCWDFIAHASSGTTLTDIPEGTGLKDYMTYMYVSPKVVLIMYSIKGGWGFNCVPVELTEICSNCVAVKPTVLGDHDPAAHVAGSWTTECTLCVWLLLSVCRWCSPVRVRGGGHRTGRFLSALAVGRSSLSVSDGSVSNSPVHCVYTWCCLVPRLHPQMKGKGVEPGNKATDDVALAYYTVKTILRSAQCSQFIV